MKKNKCKICRNYEGKEKEVGKVVVQDAVNIPIIHYWKWCKIHNNWCRNVAGKCERIVSEEMCRVDYKMVEFDEL